MRNVWLILFIVGCRFTDEQFDTDCVGSVVPVCFLTAPPPMPVVLNSDTDINTDASPMCDQGNDQMASYCVVAGSDIKIRGITTIRAHGSKPLVLLSTGIITLERTAAIDVSSKRMMAAYDIGAGGNASMCQGKGRDPNNTGGGYGGSFGGSGGKGGASLGGANGGMPAMLLLVLPGLLGGCPGGPGGNYGAPGGAGGSGGGAIALVAAEIYLDGRINASGAGGQGGSGTPTFGGGGGGSGGMIVLDASVIVAGPDASLFANGGGGGAGTNSTDTSGLMAGGESREPMSPGRGGAGVGVNGGDGSSGGTLEGQDAGSSGIAGGGGGGGAGFIHAPGVNPMVVAPPSTDG